MALYEQLAQAFVQIPVNILGVYKNPIPANGIFRGHVDHPTTKCALLIILYGQAEFMFDEAEHYQLSAGEGFFGGVNKRMEIRTGEEAAEYFLVHYLPVSHNETNSSLLTEVSTFQVELTSELLQLQEKLQSTAALPDMVSQLEQKGLFYHLVSTVLREERHGQNKESSPVIIDAVQYIQKHYDERLTLEQLAVRYGMSGKYFSYLFHKYMGIAPIDYMIRYRMKRAEELLYTTSATIQEIAEAVGYKDPNYFSRIFKTHMGLSPKKRRELRQML
ncbi:AraC family transcriptional regulator [Lysinibacillus sp. FSL H8-0500]|uniref:AraC family transcriptional regulator n=1 Tax=Lysinibacillus sp. FSL H8-0500 TaxID=2921393 RepID=UPI0031017DBC